MICEKCKAPTTRTLKLGGRELTINCLCKCQSEAFEKDEQEKQKSEEARRLNEKRAHCFGLNERLKMSTFNVDDKKNNKVSTISRRYVEKFKQLKNENKGVLFYGDVGVGKTFYAACITNALIEQGYRCMFTNLTEVTNRLLSGQTNKKELLEQIQRCDLLVLDDFGVERGTEFMQEIREFIINARYQCVKPLTITTNLSMQEIRARSSLVEKRLASRIAEMCIPVFVGGKDRRVLKV